MVKICVFFAVRTEFLNIIQTSFGFKGFPVPNLFSFHGEKTFPLQWANKKLQECTHVSSLDHDDEQFFIFNKHSLVAGFEK
jgi:hypothetical protein